MVRLFAPDIPPHASAPRTVSARKVQAHIAAHAEWSPDAAYKLLVESVRDYAMFLITTDGRIATWNIGVEHLLQYSEEQFLQLHAADIFVPEDRAIGALESEMRSAATEGRATDDRWHLRADGTRFWASGVMTALRDESGALRGYAKVMRDNTAQRLLQEEREELLDRERAARLVAEELQLQAQNDRASAEQAQRDAENADAAKDQFITVVTHELRSPLNVIMGWTHLLGAQELDAQQRVEGVNALERNAQALARLVEDLLDSARIRENRIQLDLAPVEFGPLVRQTISEFRPLAKGKDIQCHVDVKCVALVNADVGRLHQIIANLLSNSIKFTPKGGKVWVNLECENDAARLTVRDNGQGIDSEFLPNVFASFQQQNFAQGGGLGLGLWIVRSLVERHGGNVNAHSDGIGTGATFVVELPLHESHCES